MYHFQTTHLEAPEEASQFPEQVPPSPDYVPGPENPPSRTMCLLLSTHLNQITYLVKSTRRTWYHLTIRGISSGVFVIHLPYLDILSFSEDYLLRALVVSLVSYRIDIAVMSSASSAVTYTSVYTDSEPGRPVAPLLPDYIPGPEDPQTLPIPQDEDEREYGATGTSPYYLPIDTTTAESPGYITKSDPEEDLEEYEDDETKDGLVDYPMDGGDDGGFVSLLPESASLLGARPTTHSLTYHLVSSQVITIKNPWVVQPNSNTSKIASTQALIDVVTAALPSPPLPPLPPSLCIPLPVDCRDDLPESELPPRKRLCLSTLGSRYEIGESSTTRPIGGRGVDYGFVSTIDAEARQQGISEVRYGIRDTWVDPAEAVLEVAPMTVGEVNTRVTEFAELHEQCTSGTATAVGYSHSDTAPDSESSREGELRQPGPDVRIPDHQDAFRRLTVKRNDVPAYTEHFQELTLICTKFYANETEKINKYICGLPDNIYGNVKSSKPKTLDETIELAIRTLDGFTRQLVPMPENATGNKEGRKKIHPETTMVINNNPSKSKMSPRSPTWELLRRNPMGEICPSAPSATSTTMARVLRSATSATS
ncbi:hypothetical protein Tco_0601768 [Tanacetum coccineum]